MWGACDSVGGHTEVCPQGVSAHGRRRAEARRRSRSSGPTWKSEGAGIREGVSFNDRPVMVDVRAEEIADMLFAMLKAGRLLTAAEIADIERIQRERQHRSGCQYQE